MYRINEIFYSLQGEGFWTGTPMVFVRFSGCNLQCPFCDTDHTAFSEMTEEEIVAAVLKEGGPCRRACLTGGEPSLQVDATLVKALHEAGFILHIETNGTRALPEGIDWITLSPKTEVILQKADELKFVLSDGSDPDHWEPFPATWHFLQPCSCQNTRETIDYVKAHPQWRLSLQTHKYLDIK